MQRYFMVPDAKKQFCELAVSDGEKRIDGIAVF
jgi:hypothetical protein